MATSQYSRGVDLIPEIPIGVTNSFGLTSWLVLPCFTSWYCQFSGISSVAACSRCPTICSLYVTYGAFLTWGSQKMDGLVISHLEMDDFGALGYLLFRKPPYHSQSHGICQPHWLPPSSTAHVAPRSRPPGSHHRAAESTYCFYLPGLGPKKWKETGTETEFEWLIGA